MLVSWVTCKSPVASRLRGYVNCNIQFEASVSFALCIPPFHFAGTWQSISFVNGVTSFAYTWVSCYQWIQYSAGL